MTTGVALAAAGVVVANPIVAPRSDVQIPAVELSAGNGDPSGMLDQAFLDAIAPSPPESTNPFSVLRQLITSLAADATYLGKNAIVDAFVAGVTAVSQPELTASSTPYYPAVANSPELAASVLPGLDPEIVVPLTDLGVNLPATAVVASDSVAPVVQTLVGSVVTDAGFVGGQLVAAAFVAGAVVVAEPGLIGDTLEALIKGDLNGALQNAVKAVTAPLAPSVVILDALRTVVEKNLGDVATVLTETVPALQAVFTTPQTSGAVTAPTLEAVPGPAPESAAGVAEAPGAAAPSGSPAEAAAQALAGRGGSSAEQADAAVVTAAETRAQAGLVAAGAADATEAQSAGAATSATSATPRAIVRDVIESVGQQIGAALTVPGTDTARTGDRDGSSAKAVAGARSGRSASSGS